MRAPSTIHWEYLAANGSPDRIKFPPDCFFRCTVLRDHSSDYIQLVELSQNLLIFANGEADYNLVPPVRLLAMCHLSSVF